MTHVTQTVKIGLWTYVDSVVPDQPAHLRAILNLLICQWETDNDAVWSGKTQSTVRLILKLQHVYAFIRFYRSIENHIKMIKVRFANCSIYHPLLALKRYRSIANSIKPKSLCVTELCCGFMLYVNEGDKWRPWKTTVSLVGINYFRIFKQKIGA